MVFSLSLFTKRLKAFLFMLFLSVSFCSGVVYSQGKAQLSLEWELITNLHDSEYNAEAVFSLKNKGELLNEDNWTIYFSMYPMNVKSKFEDEPIEIEHINGDWFKISPREGFSLAKGESLDYYYVGDDYNIKEAFGPTGAYIVFKDSNYQEDNILELDEVKIHPFVHDRQVLQSRDDKFVPYSAEQVYEENKKLYALDSDDLFPVVPTPYTYVLADDTYHLPFSVRVSYDSSLAFEANFLMQHAKELSEIEFQTVDDFRDANIFLTIDKEIKFKEPEGYSLEINDSGIQVKGYDAAGVFYGVQSVLSLLHFSELFKKDKERLVFRYLTVDDKPRFSFRSLHVDVSRNFQTKETIFRILDGMAHYKLNNLLLYTSEDEGWRIEIPGLPELTEIGNKRLHPLNGVEDKGLMPSYGSGPFSEEGDFGTGFYSRDDFIEILEYAKERHIQVLPELNFPGHARAAIIAMEERYKRLINEGDTEGANEYRLIDPKDQSDYLSPQFYRDNVVNISRESVYRFYLKVIKEIDLMYQEAGLRLKDIFVGGDEVAEGAWSQSPEVQEWAKKWGVKKNHLALQAAFFKELLKRLENENYTLHGWEEIAISQEGTAYEPNVKFTDKAVIPYIWNNVFDYPDMGYKLANRGYEVVLCNVSNFYLDFGYNNNPQEPGHFWGGLNTTRDAWAFAPFNFQNTTFFNPLGEDLRLDDEQSDFERLADHSKANIKGLQAQLWAETIKGREMLEYYLLPRLIGFSESAWSKERQWETIPDREHRIHEMDKDWNYFANLIGQIEYPKLSKLNKGYNFRLPPVGVKKKGGKTDLNVGFPGLGINYRVVNKYVDTHFYEYTKQLPAHENLEFKSFVKLK